MLHRLAGVILGHGTIEVMVVRPALPVKHHMGSSFRVAKRPSLASHGDNLPKGSHHQK